jgi:hypothetical protein
MGLYEALVDGVAERAQRKDLSRWEKARDMLELQEFLKSQGRAHNVAQLERLTGVRRNTITEQLVIAATLTSELVTDAGVSPMALAATPHSTLLRIAQLPGPMRQGALRETVGSDEREALVPSRNIDARYRQRAQLFERLRDQGGLHIGVVEPLGQLSIGEAKSYLDLLLPAVANFAETVTRGGGAYYIGTTGNGGLLVYLSANSSATRAPRELSEIAP